MVIFQRALTEESPPKRRVAAYCRVSTQAEEQNHSLVAQISYYTKLIEADDDAELVNIYADRGTSGTRTRNRTNFLRLIEDCRAGKIDSLDSLLRKWLLQAFMARLSKTEARRCTHRTSFAPGCTHLHPMQNESCIAKR